MVSTIGERPALVLLAGIGMDSGAWRPVRPLLAATRELVPIVLPGFGDSPALPEPTVDAFAGVVQRRLRELGLVRPHVAGNSLGGAVGLELARRGAVASVTAIAPVGFWSELERRFAHRSLQASRAISGAIRPLAPRLLARPRMRRLLYGQMFAHAERLGPADALAHMDTLLRSEGFHAALPHVTGYDFPAGGLPVPATIAWGTRDALLLPSQARRARRRLPHARHVWLRGCGHLPMSDDPELVASAILRGSAAQ